MAQTGIYEQVSRKDTPREAIDNFIDSNGVIEYPIYVSAKGVEKVQTPVIKLKRSNRVVIIGYDGKVSKGKYELEAGVVTFSGESITGERQYRLVVYKSGTYLESMDGRRHFKKR